MPMSKVHDLVLLDTHIWVWLMEDVPGFSRSTLSVIRTAAQNQQIRVSAISIWEVAMLEVKKRLTLSIDCRTWIQKALSVPGLELLEMTPDIMLESTRLPGTFHADPADRIIVASARSVGATIITADKAIQAYAKEGHVKVIPA